MDTNSGNKKIWIIIIIVVIALVAWWMFSSKQAVAPVISDTTASINSQLNGLNDADLNAEFKDVAADVSKL